MEKIIAAALLGVIAAVCFAVSLLQFLKKGFLFNNAYLYSLAEEREKMEKKPHYIQSGVVFLLLGAVFSVNALDAYFRTTWLFYLSIGLVAAAIVFAAASSAVIEKRKK